MFDDGLDALRKEIGLRDIASLIERTARWVAPETFKLLPVWFPEHARRRHFYKENWTAPQMNTSRTTGSSVHKVEGNIYANQALTLALGLRKAKRPNWSCCHIWGVDDAKFQKSNDVVSDHRFYSCIGNMVLLPTPLKAFTDTMPEVKAMLRICARNLFDWECDHSSVTQSNDTLRGWSDWDAYPTSGPAPPARNCRSELSLSALRLRPIPESDWQESEVTSARRGRFILVPRSRLRSTTGRFRWSKSSLNSLRPAPHRPLFR